MLSKKSKAVFFTLLAGALWGTSFPIIKIGLETIDPFTFVFWRFLVSAVTLVAIMLALRKLDFKVQNKKLLGFLGVANAAGYLLQYVAMNYTTAAKAALFINLSAIWVALLSTKLLGETFSQKKILGVLAGLIGIVFVSTNLNFSALGEGQIVADLTLIISGLSMGNLHGLQQKISDEFNLCYFPINDMGSTSYISFNSTFRASCGSWVLSTIRLGMASNCLDGNCLLGFALLFMA